MIDKKKRFFATLFSAALIVLAFPPWNLSFLIFFALVPWLLVLDSTLTPPRKSDPSPRQRLSSGFLLSLLMGIGGFFWVSYAMVQYGGLPWVIGILGLLVFSFLGQLQFVVIAFCWRSIQNFRLSFSPLLYSILLTMFYLAIDHLTPRLFMDQLGHSLYNFPRLRQITELGGVPLLTFLVVHHNIAFRELFRTRPFTFKPYFLSLSLIAASTMFGEWKLRSFQKQIDNAPKVTAAIIQANIGDFDKVSAKMGFTEASLSILKRYTDLTKKALFESPNTDLVIWPETAYPTTFQRPSSSFDLGLDQRLEAFQREIGVPLFFGGYDSDGQKDYNALFQFEGNELKRYHKSVLLPFGETIPFFEEGSPKLKEWFPTMGFFGRGPKGQVLKWRNIQFAPAICYEILMPRYIRTMMHGGSNAILNVTNDSWFGPFGEPDLHLALSVFRSIEHRVPTIRATNTGYSAFISPLGEITAKTQIGVEETLVNQIPILEQSYTLYAETGDILPWICLTLVAAFMLHRRRKS